MHPSRASISSAGVHGTIPSSCSHHSSVYVPMIIHWYLRPNIPALWSSKIFSQFINVSNATNYKLINIYDFITSNLSDFAVELLRELHSILKVPVSIIMSWDSSFRLKVVIDFFGLYRHFLKKKKRTVNELRAFLSTSFSVAYNQPHYNYNKFREKLHTSTQF
jgi:hypothetical protein